METHEEECQVEVCQRRPREDELDGVVDELDLNQTASDGCTGQRRRNKATDLQDDLAEKVLPRRPDTEPEHGGMDGCEQRAVEPATTLGDELRDRGRDIRRGLRALDVLQARGTVSTAYTHLYAATYTQASRLLVTISKQRIRSSARYMFRSAQWAQLLVNTKSAYRRTEQASVT